MLVSLNRLGARSAWLLGALFVACLSHASSAHAYDLSRAYESEAAEVERGFVVGSVGLWFPGLGSFQEYHQLSLDYAGEFGIRIASIRGQHNIFVVGGFNVSPQKLDPDAVRDDSRRSTTMILGYAGLRYVPGMLCIGDGLGCPFVELRFGLSFESSDSREHEGPKADFTLMPGVGYRFSFGNVVQLGVRADLSVTQEYDTEDLGWLSLTGFVGVGW